MRPRRHTAALLAALLSPGLVAAPATTVPRSDKTLVELINGTMGTLPNAMDTLSSRVPGGLRPTDDAPPQIVRSAAFITRDGYRVTAFEARGNEDGGDVPIVRFTSIQLEQKPCFGRTDAATSFHGTSSETNLPAAPAMLPNRYLVMQMPWGRLSFGSSLDSGGCIIAIVGDATNGVPTMPGPLPLPLPTTVPGMPDLRRSWPTPATPYPSQSL
ncbi:hypothetical protein EC912_10572 [Luteibacter rhizovicinus]|uniref:Uncharacterized protein n=1 Tax=Luteibacter rhizovicinus TaxID=242606 RepID=A0A4R3YLZ3_9GAMM|nr:hypothetical protein [Luteibacter rhizovicinus]TCV93212.1 hypothetical protein EC912_10572 [Luteibacter rhizovicinus]